LFGSSNRRCCCPVLRSGYLLFADCSVKGRLESCENAQLNRSMILSRSSRFKWRPEFPRPETTCPFASPPLPSPLEMTNQSNPSPVALQWSRISVHRLCCSFAIEPFRRFFGVFWSQRMFPSGPVETGSFNLSLLLFFAGKTNLSFLSLRICCICIFCTLRCCVLSILSRLLPTGLYSSLTFGRISPFCNHHWSFIDSHRCGSVKFPRTLVLHFTA